MERSNMDIVNEVRQAAEVHRQVRHVAADILRLGDGFSVQECR